MNGFLSELFLALEVLKRWETLAALGGFIVVWSLFRYVALVRRKSSGLHISLPRRIQKAAPPPPAAESAAPSEGEEEGEAH